MHIKRKMGQAKKSFNFRICQHGQNTLLTFVNFFSFSTLKLFSFYIWKSCVYIFMMGPPCLWSFGSWIYNYLCSQCLSPHMLWVRISISARCTTLCDKVCQWLATGRWFSPGPSVSSINKTDCHDIAEILLKVAVNTIKQTNKQYIHDKLIVLLISCVTASYQRFYLLFQLLLSDESYIVWHALHGMHIDLFCRLVDFWLVVL